jgi:glutamine synthetase
MLPDSWGESIERAETAPFLRAALGEGFNTVLLAIKRQEHRRWESEVTPTDLLWYLRDA